MRRVGASLLLRSSLVPTRSNSHRGRETYSHGCVPRGRLPPYLGNRPTMTLYFVLLTFSFFQRQERRLFVYRTRIWDISQKRNEPLRFYYSRVCGRRHFLPIRFLVVVYSSSPFASSRTSSFSFFFILIGYYIIEYSEKERER